jgi:DNA-binding response OmpR family regulator
MTQESGPASPAKGAGRVLVVEDEPAIARLLQVELGASGFGVTLASGGAEALAAVLRDPPDVVIADVMMPGMDGFELVRRLRGDPRTEGVSIIMLTARGLKADKLEGLTAGADDYLTKPFDNEELVTRVRGVIRRARYMRSQSPLTGLPGNVRIEDEIEARIASGESFAVLYVDLDHFKAFSDRYGFARGDEALRSTGVLVREAVRRVADPGAFVGHIGGDDFVVLVSPGEVELVGSEIFARFAEVAPGWYDHEDAVRGFIDAEDREGRPRRYPLLSVSIGAASTEVRAFEHRAEAVAIATEMKSLAKRTPGSHLEVDRRRGDPAPGPQGRRGTGA